MEIENGGNGQHDLQLVNRLNESRSPYVSPYGDVSRRTMKQFKLRAFLHRFEDT